MKHLSAFLCTLMIATSAGACSSPTTPSEGTFTLAPGQTGSVGILSVRFVGVTQDSRCPINALCIQAGDAHVALEASAFGSRRSFELQMVDPARRMTEIRGYTVETTELSPYPFFPFVIAPEDYRVTLRISRP